MVQSWETLSASLHRHWSTGEIPKLFFSFFLQHWRRMTMSFLETRRKSSPNASNVHKHFHQVLPKTEAKVSHYRDHLIISIRVLFSYGNIIINLWKTLQKQIKIHELQNSHEKKNCSFLFLLQNIFQKKHLWLNFFLKQIFQKKKLKIS